MRVRCGAAALNQTPLDWEGNRRNIVTALRLAREREVSIVCLPEMCISGYGCEDAFVAPWVQATALEVLESLLPETRGLVAAVGLPLALNGVVYDAAALLADGELVGCVAKTVLAGDGLHYEPRWFKPWPGGVAELEFAGGTVPVGDLSFQLGEVKLGFEICEDAWAAQRPGARLALDGADLVLNTSASHFAFGKHEVRERLVLEGSRSLGVGYVYANLLGNEAGRALYDGHTLIASSGNLLARGRRFSFQEVELVDAVVDLEKSRVSRAKLASFQPPLPGRGRVRARFAPPPAPPTVETPEPAAWERGGHVKEEELTRAVALGLFDYMRKSRSRGFVVSLSGGADSSAVASLCRVALDLARLELGDDVLAARLGYWPELFEAGTAWPARWLTTAYQSTANSGEQTRGAARKLAGALASRHLELDVQAQVSAWIEDVGGALGRRLSWERDDVSLQNIQARARAPGVWMLANLGGALLLSTSNRSEAAVGYATMDGDTAGGLCPIAGVDKAYLRRWLRWLETPGPEGLGPIPALRAVNALTPTAELRPAAAAQTDEDDLMPYPVLDVIERALIRDWQSPDEVVGLLCARFPEYERALHVTWLKRFCLLFARNQWKRERYAPSFHLDDENLDPKTWCRFPILSGGFQRALARLEQEASGGS